LVRGGRSGSNCGSQTNTSTRIYEGTNQIQRVVIAKQLLG